MKLASLTGNWFLIDMTEYLDPYKSACRKSGDSAKELTKGQSLCMAACAVPDRSSLVFRNAASSPLAALPIVCRPFAVQKRLAIPLSARSVFVSRVFDEVQGLSQSHASRNVIGARLSPPKAGEVAAKQRPRSITAKEMRHESRW